MVQDGPFSIPALWGALGHGPTLESPLRQAGRKVSPGRGRRRGEAGFLQAQQGSGQGTILAPLPRGGSKASSWASPCCDFSWGQWGAGRPSAHDLTTAPASSLAQADTSVGGDKDSPWSPCHAEPSAHPPPEPHSVLPQTAAPPCGWPKAPRTRGHTSRRVSVQGRWGGPSAKVSSDPLHAPTQLGAIPPPGPTMDPLKLKWASGSLPNLLLCISSLICAFYSLEKYRHPPWPSHKVGGPPSHPVTLDLQTADTYSPEH